MTSLPTGLEPRTRPGRPLRLTQDIHDTIVAAVEQGSYLKIAAQTAGVGQSTLAGWLARGREAASAVERHDPDRRYCPACDRDREDEVAAVEAHNTHADTQPPADRRYTALDRCPAPTCRSDAYPAYYATPDRDAPYLELLESVTRAQADAEVAAVSAWRAAWRDDWRAARDYLARTAPERWAGVTRVQMTTEEAERRIDDAVNEALLAVGIDLPGADPVDAALDEGLDP